MTLDDAVLKGTRYEITERGVRTVYKVSLRGIAAWFRQSFCPHPHEDQKLIHIGEPELTAQLCRCCGWARSVESPER